MPSIWFSTADAFCRAVAVWLDEAPSVSCMKAMKYPWSSSGIKVRGHLINPQKASAERIKKTIKVISDLRMK